MDEIEMKRTLPEAPPAFRIWLCGMFSVERLVDTSSATYQTVRAGEWGGSSHPRLLLKALLHYSGRQARREALLEMLWSENDIERATQKLNTATTKLRKVLQPTRERESLLVVEDTGYYLEGQQYLWVDTDAALALLKEAERLGYTNAQALPHLEEAVKYLSRGTFLEDEDGLWLYGSRNNLKEAFYNGRRWLAEAYVTQGMIGQAELQWRALLSDDPTDEDVLRQAITQLHHQNMAHKAWRLYKQTIEQLAQEGLEPTKEMQAFAEHIRNEPLVTFQDRRSSLQLRPQSASLLPGFEAQTAFQPVEHEALIPVYIGRSLSLSLEDSVAWFGGKLAHLLTIIENYCRQPISGQEIQDEIGKELNTMLPKTDDEEYTHSRRQILITLATLPSALLLTMLQGRLSSGRSEQFLTRCASSLVACWHLMRGSEYAVVEELLPSYLPLLENLAQEPSKYQNMAASLATQGYRLKGILALHRNDAKARDTHFQRAVYYAEIAQNPGLLVAALISLAYHKSDPIEAEYLYQKALVYEQAISPLQRTRLYAQLSVAYAQENKEGESMHYLFLAQQEYPQYPENDPGFLYAEFSPASMILEMGRVHLALSQHQSGGKYPQQAWETFAGVDVGSSKFAISERIRCEIINYQAQTALALQDLDLCCEYIEMGARGATLLGSVRRRKEVMVTRNKALKLWPHDGRVKELRQLFA